MTYRMKPLSSILTLFVAVGALHCGDDDTAATPTGTAGKAGASGKAGSGGTGGGASGTGGTGGASGAAGKGGTGGKAGASGAAGKGGSAGKAGAAGAAGKAGAAGAAGKAGAAGAAGKAGAAGAAGKAGAAGAAGKAGAAGSSAGQGGATAGQGGTDQGGQAGTDQGGQGGTDQGGQGGTDQGGQGGSDPGGAGGTDAGGQGGDSGAGGSVIVVGDFTVAVAQPSVTVVQGQTVTIDVNLTKDAPFDSPVTLSFDNLPVGLTAPADPIVIPAGATTLQVVLTAAADATVTSATITVRAKADGGFDKSATFDVTVQQAPDYTVSADQSALTISAGNSGTINVAIARVGGFADAVNVEFENLPAGVTATPSPAPIGAGDTVSITLAVDASAVVGDYSGIIIHAKSGTAFDKTTTLSLKINPAVANIATAVAINSGDDGDSPFKDFRQGFTNVRIKITGTGIAGIGAAGIRLGTLTPTLVQDKAGYTVASFDIPHGESLGAKDVSVTNVSGTGTAAGVVIITPIAVRNNGDDNGVGRGTPLSPFRTITKANSVAAGGDTIQLLSNTANNETFPITLKANTNLEGVPNGTTLPSIGKNGAPGTCLVIAEDSGSISKVRFNACEVQKNGAGLLNVSDVLANATGDVGFNINAGEAKFACTDPTLACTVTDKKKAFIVAAGAKISGGPVVGTATEMAFQVSGIADLAGPQITGSAPVALWVTGNVMAKDAAFTNIGPTNDDGTQAAFLVGLDGVLTLEGGTATIRRRAVRVLDNGVVTVGGSWTGPTSDAADPYKQAIVVGGNAKVAVKKLTYTQPNDNVDFLVVAGINTVTVEDSVLKSTATGNNNRGIVGYPGGTSTVTVTNTSFERFRSGAIYAPEFFGGTINVGAGTSFLTGGATATNANLGALVDERSPVVKTITVAAGVQFNGTLIVPGEKDATTAPAFFGNPAVKVWAISGGGKILFQ